MKKALFLITVGSIFLAGCGVLYWRNTAPVVPMGGRWWGRKYDSNGEMIYFTASNDSGYRIPYTGGPAFGSGMMMGSSVTCASCHGADGRGGIHTMHMQVMDAPDIRYVALTSNEDDDHGEDSHADEHGEYDLEDFRQAVLYGKHPNGDFLSSDMPRWKIGERDLKDLFDFIKTLP